MPPQHGDERAGNDRCEHLEPDDERRATAGPTRVSPLVEPSSPSRSELLEEVALALLDAEELRAVARP